MAHKEIEKALGYPLPLDLVLFLNTTDTEKYRDLEYSVTLADGYKITNTLESFSSYETFWQDNKYRDFIEDFQEEMALKPDYVESEFLYIIGECSGGSICMALAGQHKGKIYNVDNGDFGITFQANTLGEFWAGLYPGENDAADYEKIKGLCWIIICLC